MNWGVWAKACEAWTRIRKMTGFETREIAFTQGYYMGYNKAVEDIENADENQEEEISFKVFEGNAEE